MKNNTAKTMASKTMASKFCNIANSNNVWDLLDGVPVEYPNGTDSSDASIEACFSDGSRAFIGNPDERVFDFFCYSFQRDAEGDLMS